MLELARRHAGARRATARGAELAGPARRPVRRLASPGLVRRGGGPVPRRGRRARRRAAATWPRRRSAPRSSTGARESSRRGGARGAARRRVADLTTAVAVSAQSVDSLLLRRPARARRAHVARHGGGGAPAAAPDRAGRTRAGFARVLVQSVPRRRPPARRHAATRSRTARPTPASRCRSSSCRPTSSPSRAGCARCARSPIEAETLYADAALAAVVDTDDPAAVLAAAARCRGAASCWRRCASGSTGRPRGRRRPGRFPLAAAGGRAAGRDVAAAQPDQAQRGLHVAPLRAADLAGAHATAGRTRVTPNAMTLVSARDRARSARRSSCPSAPAVQLAGALLFLAPLDPRRLRRRARAAQVPGVAARRAPRLLGRQRRARRGVRAAWRSAGASPRRRPGRWRSARSRSSRTLGAAASPVARTSCGTRRSARRSRRGRAARRRAFQPRLHLSDRRCSAASARRHWFLVLAAVGTPIFVLLLLWAIGARRRA